MKNHKIMKFKEEIFNTESHILFNFDYSHINIHK